MNRKYNKILLKLSGEILAGGGHFGLDYDAVRGICEEIAEVAKEGIMVSMVVGGVAEVSMVEAVGVFTIDESGDRIFSSMQSEERTELGTKVFDPFTSTMSGYVYYDPVTGEAAYRSQHDLQYTGVLHEGSLTCEDGIFVTETCKNCDHTATYTRSSHLYEQEETVYETQCGDVVIRDEVCSVCGDKQHYVNYYGNHEFSIQSKEILTSERFAGEIAALEQEGYPAEEAEEKVRENYACIEDLAGHDFPTANFASGDAQERHCAVCGLNVTCYTYYTGTGDAADCTYHTAYVFDYRGNDYFEGFGATDHFARHSHRYEGSEVMPQMSVSEAVSEFEAASGISLGFTPDSVYVYDSECVMCGDQDTRDYHFSSDEGSSADATIDYTNGTAVSWSLYETLYGDHIGARLSDYEAYLNGFAYEDGRAEYRANGTIGNGTGCTEYEYYYVTLYAADGMDGRDEFRLYVTLNDLNSASGYGTLRTEHYVYSECTVYETEYGYENGGWVQSGTQTSERHDMTYEEVHAGHCTEDGRLTVEQCKVCGKTEEPSMQLEYSHSYRYVGAEGTNVAEIAKDCSVNGLTGMSANYSYRERCEYCGDLSGLTLILTDDWTLTQDEYIRATDLTIDLNGYTIDLNGYSLLVYGYRDQYEMRGSVTFTDSAYDTSAEEGGAQSGAIVNSGASGVFAVFVNGGDILMGTVSVTAEAYMSDGDNLYTIYDSLLENGYDVSIAQAQSPMFSYSLMEYGDMKFYAIDGIDAPQAAGGYLESYVAAESGELDMQFFVVSVKMSAGEQFMFDVQTNEGITVYVTSENGSNSAKASYNGSGSGTVTISSDLQPSYDEDGTVHYPEVWVTYVIGVSNCYEMGLDHGDAMFTNFRVE